MKNLVSLCTLILLMISILAACTPTASTPAVPRGGIETPAPTSSDVFQVTAWVDNPYPKAGERINISGSLIKNGVYLGGMMMSGFWPDEKDDRLPDCHIQVIYQRGICIAYADNFPVGEPITVKVSFDYFGQTFSGETSFTRQE
jgi:hypothetical protein